MPRTSTEILQHVIGAQVLNLAGLTAQVEALAAENTHLKAENVQLKADAAKAAEAPPLPLGV